MVFIRIAVFLAILLILYAIYEIIGLFRKRANTYYASDDGRLRCFGNAVFNISSDCYVFHDNNQPISNRYQGNSNIDNGLALINLRKDPSATDLSLEVNKQGWVDLAGNIYGVSGIRLGFITDAKGRPGINGSGKWYELWLRKHSYVYTCPPLASENGNSNAAQNQLIGKIVETGRIGKAKPNTYTTTARAGGFLLLYKGRQPKPASEDFMADKLTWKDTALPATVLFTILYFIFYFTGIGKMNFPALTTQIGFIAAMLFVYFVIWTLLRQIKIEASLDGKAFDDFIMLIDRNTGIGGLNNWIILTAAASLLASIYIFDNIFIPLQAAILIGVWVNRKYITKEPWVLADVEDEEENGLPDWDNQEEDGNSPDDTFTPDDSDLPDTETEKRTFNWKLDSWNHDLSGDLTLNFNPQKIEALRSNNPFHINPNGDFRANTTQILESCNNRKVHEVLKYIDKQIRLAGLGDLDRMQFILDFVQKPNIEYEVDEKCPEIGNPREYVRFPDETMFDRRGDCDCKAALAAVLFREAGYKTAYLTTSNHAAIAVAFRDKSASDLISMADQSLITKDGYLYFFCETTGDGFKIGDLGNTTKEAVTDIIFLN